MSVAIAMDAEIVVADDLPEGWIQTTMGDVADVIGGGTPKASDPSNFSKKGYAWITPADLSGYDRMYIERGARDLSKKGLHSCSAKLMPRGAVLMSSRAPIGYVAIAENEICTNQGFRSFVCAKGIAPKYVYYWLRFMRPVIEDMGSGSTFTEISGSKCKEIPLLLSPLAEQKRIVKKVEALLARVSAARERLAKAPAILKRFRQTVLAAACSGNLTEDWRINQKLVSSVHTSRQQLLEAGSEWYEANFEKRPEQELPDLWEYVALGNLGAWGGGGTPSTSKPEYWEKGTIPWVSPKDMKSELISHSQDHITRRALSETNLKLIPEGSLLFVVRGMILAHTFPVGLSTLPVTVNQDIRTLTPYKGVSREFLLRAMRYEATSILHVVRESTHGTRRLESETLKNWPIPVPPIEEQHEIIRRVEGLFKLADTIEKRVAAATMRADKLTQAILSKAFRGELVPTEAELAHREDRDYETATQLLDRITADRRRIFSPIRKEKVAHKKRVLRQHWRKQ